MAADNILELRDLRVEFDTHGGSVQAVRGVDLAVARGRTLAVVGESGCGKSVTMQAVMGLIPRPPGRITGGEAWFEGRDLLKLSETEMNALRGARIGMIFQDPMTSLNPTLRIGEQIAESLCLHRGMSAAQAWSEAVRLLDRTRIPEAAARARQYPFEFSGGMLQRVMIAISLACQPALLIADEPTTALDVTIQNQVLALMREIQQEQGMALILITHDLGVVARMADDVAVMYAGQVVESGPVVDIFERPAHPYTLGLRRALPSRQQHRGERLTAIPGSPPDLFAPPAGCGYAARCPQAMRVCESHAPVLDRVVDGRQARCWLQHPAGRSRAGEIFVGGEA